MLSPLREFGLITTGIDADEKTIREAGEANIHDELRCADASILDKSEQFDVVVCSHVIEHFTRENALELIPKLESIARKLLYIETPVGFLPQGAVEGNQYQRHLSGWFPEDFIVRGYSVYGSGLRLLRGSEGKSKLSSEFVTRFIERSTQNLAFRFPRIAHAMAAIRVINNHGDIELLP